MGWQDAPVVESGATPAWASAPEITPQKPGVAARTAAGVGGFVAGLGELFGLGGPIEVAEYAAGRQPQEHFPVAGPFGASAEQVRSVERQAGDVRKGVEKAGGVLPAVGGALAAPFEKLYGAFEKPPQTIGQAYDVGKAGAQAAATLEGGLALTRGAAGLIGRGAEAISRRLPTAPAAEIVKQARSSGYVVKPSEAGGKVGTVIEGVTGSPRLSIEATIKNQKNTNRLVAEELGLPPDTKLTPAKIVELKRPHNAVYAEMGKLGPIQTDQEYLSAVQNAGRTPGTSFQKVRNPDLEALREGYSEAVFDAKDGVLQIKKLRADARKNIKNPDPAKNEVGYAQKEIADALEAQMERHAQAIGQGDLVDRFRNARRELAKIYNVEDALVTSTGDISASKLARARGKGAPLSGNLAKIADVHDAFPSEMRDVAKVRNKVPVTVLEGLGGTVGGVAAATSKNPLLGVGALGAVTGRPLARKFLLSEAYQSRLAPGKTGTPAPTIKPTSPTKEAIKKAARTGLTLKVLQQSQEQPQ